MERMTASLEAQPKQLSPEEQRAAPRLTLLIRPAKLTTPEGEFICVIRDVSETGVSVRLFHTPPSGSSASLETETGQVIQMEQVWIRDREAGYRFAKPIDVDALINEKGRYGKRKLRLGIEMPVTLGTQGQEYDAMIKNMSQFGALIECDARLAIQQIVCLKARHLSEVQAKVLWRREKRFGLIFENTFTMAEFAHLAATLQSPSLLGR